MKSFQHHSIGWNLNLDRLVKSGPFHSDPRSVLNKVVLVMFLYQHTHTAVLAKISGHQACKQRLSSCAIFLEDVYLHPLLIITPHNIFVSSLTYLLNININWKSDIKFTLEL